MAKKIAIGVGGLILVLIIVIATRPAAYHVERSTEIAAPAADLFALVEDFNRFGEWSPWAKLDPQMKVTVKGKGKGSTYEWQGNEQAGKGIMTITESTPPKTIRQDLEFVEPFANKAKATFQLAPAGEKTKITWLLDGDLDFMGKTMSLFMDMTAMVGKDYEAGLAALKTIAEKEAAAKRTAEEEAAKKAAEEAAPIDGEAKDASKGG